MGEALQHYGDLQGHIELQPQNVDLATVQVKEGFIPQQRQVSDEIMAIGRASREAFMRPQVEARNKTMKLAENLRQKEKLQAIAVDSLARSETEWYELAKCRDSDIDFFPENVPEGVLKRMARTACSGCFVKDQCLEDELAWGPTDQFGIRGATTPRERRAMLNKKLGIAS